MSAARVVDDLPGDKSISHRALLCALLADGPSRVRALNAGADVAHTLRAIAALGARVAHEDDVVEITPGPRVVAPTDAVDCGNAGTLARLAMGLLAGQGVVARLVGDPSLSSRPMLRVARPLARLFGVDVVALEGGARLPAILLGARPRDDAQERVVDTEIQSAQVKSAVLFAALARRGRTIVTEPAPTRAHTERLFAHLGLPVTTDGAGRVVVDEGARRPRAFALSIPRDPSALAFRLAYAIGVGAPLHVDDVLVSPRRTGALSVLARAGADISIEETGGVRADGFEASPDEVGRVVVGARDLNAPISTTSADAADLIDEVPALVVLAATRAGRHVFDGIDELRVKESDRVALLARGLAAFGVEARSDGSALVVEGRARPVSLADVRIETAGDHRIAMAFHTLGLIWGRRVLLDDAGCVDVSEPGFFEKMARLARAA